MAMKILRGIIAFMMAVFAIALTIIIIGIVALPFFHADIAAEIAKDGQDMATWQAILLIEGLLIGVAGLVAMIEYFMLLLWRMLKTVREGDPFAPVNATRLTRMAWTAVAGNLWAIVLAIYAAFLESHIADEGSELDFSFSGAGPILILVLFVLAQVFRKGTEMRADLEGTV